MNDLPVPYGEYLFIEPVVDAGVLTNTLNHYGKVLALGPDVKATAIGEYVAFEKWDKPGFPLQDGRVCHFLKESEAICRLPLSWV